MVMDCSWDRARFVSTQYIVQELPEEIIAILRHGSTSEYLDTLTALALDSRFTSTIYVHHGPLFLEFCSRWLTALDSGGDPFAVIAAIARILPFAPHLAVYIEGLLLPRKSGILQLLLSREVKLLVELPDELLQDILLAFCRLLMFDNQTFASLILPAEIQILLSHRSRSIRYLAVRVLCLYLHAADASMIEIAERYVGVGEISGPWEDKTIDYTFFSLWEEKRLKDVHRQVENHRSARCTETQIPASNLVIQLKDLSPMTACIAGVLIPRLSGKTSRPTPITMTKTTSQNMRLLAKAIKGSQSVLVTGPSGVGKTCLIRDMARELNRSSSVVTLHLNEQTDAKLLIGVYTSDRTPGSFSWQPGVLTTAVMEGRWIIIEDLDRAPTEVMGTLLPLLERGELLISNRAEPIYAASGFKIIATVRTITTTRGEEAIPMTSKLGSRHWVQVPLRMPTDEELAEIIVNSFPILHAHVPKIINVHTALNKAKSHAVSTSRFNPRPIKGRVHGPQDLLRWCARIENLLRAAGAISGREPMSESLNDNIFLEAVDCFARHSSMEHPLLDVVTSIAQELHLPAERARFCLKSRDPGFSNSDTLIHIGRAYLSKKKSLHGKQSLSQRTEIGPFAMTKHSLRLLESVGIAVKMAEPCLLVGETGTGKTTVVQQLANLLRRKLTVVNLSQQSEAGDLLGGYKPVNARALAMPMKDEFQDLFESTFSSKRNKRYTDVLGKTIARGQWLRTLTLWQEALKMVENNFNLPILLAENIHEQPSKRRKLESPNYQKLKARWDKFASDVRTFELHLGSSSKGFAFSYVEGNIVNAARNGDWVLLDEINLASPDTLESLADLLSAGIGDGPSLLLPETGNTERIYAHKEFRIFGAMNPATDVGKRDLPMSLRSRFTEIFIDPPDKDIENLVPIIRVYLGNHMSTDVRVASDIASLYLQIQKLAEENRIVDGAKQQPHFSLRTLTRTLVYVTDIAPTYGLRRALFEGFSMSFLTLLDRESELLLLPLIETHLLGPQKNARASLHQTPRHPSQDKQFVQFKHYWIARGYLAVEMQPHYIITPFIERNLLNLVRATSTRRSPVLLQGPTSSGKTSMIQYLARLSGNKFIRINNHEHTDLQEYLGTYVSGPDGQLRYQEGVLVHALREGHWIVLDELNLAPTDVLEALNRLLDDNRELLIPETQQIVRPHENFMLFATQNPAGTYGGRKVLSRAFRNRFLELHFDDIPEDELETILRERSQIAPSFCAKIVTVYKKLSILRQSGRLFEKRNSFATLRDLFRWALRDADDREQLAHNGFMLLAERVRNTEERSAVKKVIEDVMKVKIDESRVYSIANTQELELSRSTDISPGVIWTGSMRRLYVLVTEALKNKEPVLLVGETGCGKTTICQVIANIMHMQLHVVNAHQNTETGDIIGAQRPIRNRAAIESQLIGDLVTFLKSNSQYELGQQDGLPVLLEAYTAMQGDETHDLPLEMCHRIEHNRAKLKALFEWSDGSLVQAMKTGQYFLLDEISLADDSVLERLNSVLEPGRALLLAEKGQEDAQVIASEGFQFLATMNPGGDYGKRELSLALRNRFTEIWVPQVTEFEEMLDIVQTSLAPSFAQHAPAMVTFAAWFGTTYNSAASTFSIRELLGWVEFLNTFQTSDQYLSLLHGAAMTYIDSLGANPAAKIAIAVDGVFKERLFCLSKLSELFHHDMEEIYNAEVALSVTDQSLSIGPFNLARSSRANQDPSFCLHAPTTKANAMKIIRALQLQKPILVEGSPGVGKTALIEALAQTIGMPLTRINLSEQTDLMDLFGSDVPVEGADAGQFAWRDAPFLRAMQNGEWVLLDEMNLASQSVLEGLNACLDHRGQIYVSELDQTFSRHHDFVLFAAQNPHHQGGGRKGLPTSFVNRFTVVYADVFLQNDLLIICRQRFPNFQREKTQNLIACVSALSQLIYHDRSIGSQGGPWEFNLRDVLRWLELLNCRYSLSQAGNPTDYKDMLFLQRFRTREDVAAISDVFLRLLPQTNQPRSYFYNLSPNSIQIGLGLLPRNPLVQSIRCEPAQHSIINLPIAESIILCVQKNWPCLLVGSEGSGKTTIILQLAYSVGADIVQMPLNADMDTMDLIGGYEQIDVQRQVASFRYRFRDYVRTNMIRCLRSSTSLPEDFIILDELLRVTDSEIGTIHEQICRTAEKSLLLGSSGFRSECEQIIGRRTHIGGARFEWVDGILVKALQHGQWLVLENANLCNSSVLDRLNSLLEPNGFLSINEHRSSDGSSRIIKPHPNFRIFLTMDPRHGELSRAMRNRSVELFISPATSLTGPLYSSESFTSRFRIFGDIDWSTRSDLQFCELAKICFDHLAVPDYSVIRQWYEEVRKGLVYIPLPKQGLLSSICETYVQISCSPAPVVKSISHMYGNLSEIMSPITDFCRVQTIHPLNNSNILPLIAQVDPLADPYSLGNFLEVAARISLFEKKLLIAHERIDSKKPSQMTRLERSLASNRVRSFMKDSTQPLGAFLEIMGRFLRDEVDHQVFKQSKNRRLIAISAETTLSYLNDIFDLGQSPGFDEGLFQVYLTLGKSINASKIEEHQKLDIVLAHELNVFNESWQLTTGLSMEILWTILRPPTAKNLSQLQFHLQVEDLAARFDALAWRSGAAVFKLNDLRYSIIRMDSCVGQEHTFSNYGFDDITSALVEFESKLGATSSTVAPYFQDQFEQICQYHACASFENSIEMQSSISLLAGRCTKDMMMLEIPTNDYGLLWEIPKFTGIKNVNNALAIVQNVLPVSMLHKIANIADVPLRSLGLLRTEITTMSESTARLCASMASDSSQMMSVILSRLQLRVFKAHQSYLDTESFTECSYCLTRLWQKVPLDPVRSNALSVKAKPGLPKSASLGYIIENFFNPSLLQLGKLEYGSDEDISRTAFAWVLFFTGCLLLYVPDRAFDPALKLVVERDRHNKRKMELETRVEALRGFESVFTGQTRSVRRHLVEQDLQALGDGPHVAAIARPPISELGKLQGEFSSILKSIVRVSPDLSILRYLTRGDPASTQEAELLRSNIAQAVSRLQDGFRTYDDITKPVIGMLQGLDVGLAVALLAGAPATSAGHSVRSICNSTPFLGMRKEYLHRTSIDDLKVHRTQNLDPRFPYLRAMALIKSVDPDIEIVVIRTMLEAFHSFYEEWKEQLQEDQQQNATKTSLYRYQGGEEDSNDSDALEFLEIFPDYDAPSEPVSTASKADPKTLAWSLARCQRAIFTNDVAPSQRLLDTLQDASSELAAVWKKTSILFRCPVPPERMLSGLMLALDQTSDNLLNPSRPDLKYNFYQDSNLTEAQKLVALGLRIGKRFTELRDAWPEHATLGDVIRTLDEMLDFRHTEPLAKILTKAEQLHGYVHEWQVVASREYSAINLYNELTELLISWRRLELSTWSRLLDVEDQKCSDDVQSWWFVAYEVIIAAPISLINGGGDVQSHAEQLFTTLGEFLTNTSIGQYSQRIRLIECFRNHLQFLEKDMPSFRLVYTSLVNFLGFYTRFEKIVKEPLYKGRQALAQDMKEILLLASWKDTNINALRDSAKRSHHKLFKLVRKYRALLAQPAGPIIMQGLSQVTDPFLLPSLKQEDHKERQVDQRALRLCQDHLQSWATKPARFSNPGSTGTDMKLLIQLSPSAIDGSLYLESFATSLIDSIKVLQSETPSTLTEGNKDLVKHLKSRKRKAFADTLKELRKMGFRSNLGADALAKQSSLSKILTQTPALRTATSDSDSSVAEFYLHKILDVMPRVRELGRGHSEEITHGAMTRSIGYLESILTFILRQRAVSINCQVELDAMNHTIQKLQSLWAPDLYRLQKYDKRQQSADKEVERTVRWLPSIIDVGCIIISKHNKLGGTDSSVVIGGLVFWKDRMIAMVEVLNTLPAMPLGLSTSLHEQTYHKAESELAGLRTALQSWAEEHAILGFVLRQIELWTESSTSPADICTNGEQIIKLKQLDEQMSKVLDTILVAIQNMHEKVRSMPSSDEDTTWLMQLNYSLGECMRALHARGINRLLDQAMTQTHRTDTSSSLDLKVAGAIFAMALPIIQEYREILRKALERYTKLHRSSCKLASVLAQSLFQLGSRGFCSPEEKQATNEGKTEKLETGTGLGEGEGNEDISKDIQDDEDLDELAQEANQHMDKEEIQDQENAVDMGKTDMEGEMADSSEKGEDEEDGSQSEGENDNVEEETGEVDDLDPSAIDEKLWNGDEDNAEKELEGDQSKGKKQKDEQTAAKEGQKDKKIPEDEIGDELREDGEDENDEVTYKDGENIDPHLEEGQNLELPEEMELDGEKNSVADSESSSDGMDGLSDIDQERAGEEQADAAGDDSQDGESAEDNPMEGSEVRSPRGDEDNYEDDVENSKGAESPVDTEPDDESQNNDPGQLQNRDDDATVDTNNIAPSEMQGLGKDPNEQLDDGQTQEDARASGGTEGNSSKNDETKAVAEEGQLGQPSDMTDAIRGGNGSPPPILEDTAFKKLGDALETWHRHQEQIQDASDRKEKREYEGSEVDMAGQDFEHLRDENTEADTQALGAATEDQAHGLDEQALDSQMHDHIEDFLPDMTVPDRAADEDEVMEDIDGQPRNLEEQQAQMKSGTVISDSKAQETHLSQTIAEGAQDKKDIDDLDSDLSTIRLQPADDNAVRSAEDARLLWSHYENVTRDLSLSLTEQLRLILAPTLATKMRGDFRTGKRLNIKRIIPYIASQYKRDKIWMRRSIPSKRKYQIMLAVDDSKSMGESGSGQLAFETLALVSKSLSMLEVGEICVVGFGDEVRMAHHFDKPFSSEAGVRIFQQFGFQQQKTDVRKLVVESINLFREARRKAVGAGMDLWQLELIISDGVCEDHETIKRLVRQAQEERIMIVFVIVDSLKGESIMDMNQAVFEPNENGETNLKIRRYLDGFPFGYYLVVGDVRELPGVLATALRQWFAEVVDSG